jgi:hypothetical protein
MQTFMTFVVGFFVLACVFAGLVWVLGVFLQPLGFLLEKLAGPAAATAPKAAHRPRAIYYCKGSAISSQPYPASEGGHSHKAYAGARACMDQWMASTRHSDAGVPCPACGRNHFSPECPPTGHRVADARTGEVVGYWREDA